MLKNREVAWNSAVSERSHSRHGTRSDTQLEILLRTAVHSSQFETSSYCVSR